jgi:hypothetical protein
MKHTAIPSPPPNYPDLYKILSAVKENIELINGDRAAGIDCVQLRISSAPPTNVRDGMVAYADGGNWNPGSGRGLYIHTNGAWKFIA